MKTYQIQALEAEKQANTSLSLQREAEAKLREAQMVADGHYLRASEARQDREEAVRQAEHHKREAAELQRTLEQGFGEEGAAAVRVAEVRALQESMVTVYALMALVEELGTRSSWIGTMAPARCRRLPSSSDSW